MSRYPGTRDACFQCGSGFDEVKPDWTVLPFDPPKFAHRQCVHGKRFRIPGKSVKPGEPLQANILVRIDRGTERSMRNPEPAKPAVRNSMQDFKMETEAHQSPVALYVLCHLTDATRPGVERVHFERIPGTAAESDKLVVLHEKNRSVSEHARYSLEKYRKSAGLTHLKLWQMIVRRLKVLSGMVDHGPNPSVDGYVSIRMSKNRTVTFYMPTNPNPYTDNKVTLIATNAR